MIAVARARRFVARPGAARALACPPARTPWLCAALSAVLCAAALRPWGVGALGWVALVPLFAAVEASRPSWRAGPLAGIAALGAASVGYEAVAALGVGWYLLATLVACVPFVLAAAAARAVGRRLPRWLAWLTLPLFWGVAELLPAQPLLFGSYALPLTVIGYSQAELPALHLARFSSVTATSVAVLLGNALVLRLGAALLARSPRGSRVFPPALGLTALAVLVALAWAPAGRRPVEPDPQRLTVGVLQPNHPTALLAAAQALPAVRAELFGRLAALDAVGRAASLPGLAVWPEAAWPGVLRHEEGAALLDEAARRFLATQPPALFGAAAEAPTGNASNAAFAWDGVRLAHAYDKLHLVPLGERGLTPGSRVRLASLAGVGAAPLICYDVVFPATVRAAARAGAELLAVLTDDAFAARGDVPVQHLRVARFRAVESGLPLAFASNTGPSAIFDGRGRVLAASAANESTALRATLGEGAGPTPYVRYGDRVGALLCLIAAVLVAMALAGVAGTKGGAPSEPRTT